MANQRKKVGAGWMKTTEDGKKFISIVINGGLSPDINLTIWPNGYKKEGSNQPDFNIYLSDRTQQQPQKAAGKSEFPEASAGSEFPGSESTPDDDIPF